MFGKKKKHANILWIELRRFNKKAGAPKNSNKNDVYETYEIIKAYVIECHNALSTWIVCSHFPIQSAFLLKYDFFFKS